jgi:hypothetical protein
VMEVAQHHAGKRGQCRKCKQAVRVPFVPHHEPEEILGEPVYDAPVPAATSAPSRIPAGPPPPAPTRTTAAPPTPAPLPPQARTTRPPRGRRKDNRNTVRGGPAIVRQSPRDRLAARGTRIPPSSGRVRPESHVRPARPVWRGREKRAYTHTSWGASSAGVFQPLPLAFPRKSVRVRTLSSRPRCNNGRRSPSLGPVPPPIPSRPEPHGVPFPWPRPYGPHRNNLDGYCGAGVPPAPRNARYDGHHKLRLGHGSGRA